MAFLVFLGLLILCYLALDATKKIYPTYIEYLRSEEDPSVLATVFYSLGLKVSEMPEEVREVASKLPVKEKGFFGAIPNYLKISAGLFLIYTLYALFTQQYYRNWNEVGSELSSFFVLMLLFVVFINVMLYGGKILLESKNAYITLDNLASVVAAAISMRTLMLTCLGYSFAILSIQSLSSFAYFIHKLN